MYRLKTPSALWDCMGRHLRAGRPTRIVRATRDVGQLYGPDIYAGQLCVVAEAPLCDSLFAVRYEGKETVAQVSRLGHKLDLAWGVYPEMDRVKVAPEEVEIIGQVLGMDGRDWNPLLWMYGN